jgi:hypothetical protein
MALRAVGLDCVVLASVATLEVLLLCHRLQVVGVDTGSIATNMVDL